MAMVVVTGAGSTIIVTWQALSAAATNKIAAARTRKLALFLLVTIHILDLTSNGLDDDVALASVVLGDDRGAK